MCCMRKHLYFKKTRLCPTVLCLLFSSITSCILRSPPKSGFFWPPVASELVSASLLWVPVLSDVSPSENLFPWPYSSCSFNPLSPDTLWELMEWKQFLSLYHCFCPIVSCPVDLSSVEGLVDGCYGHLSSYWLDLSEWASPTLLEEDSAWWMISFVFFLFVPFLKWPFRRHWLLGLINNQSWIALQRCQVKPFTLSTMRLRHRLGKHLG